MAKPTVSIPQGMRDFDAATLYKRNYILHTIRTTFELYGFTPLETPTMENLDTLMGKYGDEGDKLLFKVLNNGLSDTKNAEKASVAFANILQGKSDKSLTERALRYDLTIPFARYVAMNHNTLTMPYKRYQIQPVWRADRPQRGRYREFVQCDADIVGSNSLLNEVDLINIYTTVFAKLNLPIVIKINNRKILAALAVCCGGLQHLTNITVAIDKLDKIGLEKVLEELATKELSIDAITIIKQYLQLNNAQTNNEKLTALRKLLGSAVEDGATELQAVCNTPYSNTPLSVTIDFTLARGLNYYTATILEVQAIGVAMGSIGGGGRYNNLTATFGVPNIAGVGISFGVDRIYDVLEELHLFSNTIVGKTTILFFNLGTENAALAYNYVQLLRKQGTATELYHDVTKTEKQYKYAEAKGCTYVVLINDNDIETKTCTVKNIVAKNVENIELSKLATYPFI